MSTYLSWFWQASRGSRFQIAMGAMAGIAHVAVSMVFVYACKTLVDIATGVSDKNLLEYTLLLIAVILGQITFSALKNRLAARNDIILKNNLRYRLFSHVMSVCYDGRKGRHTGDILNRLEEDVRVISDALSNAFPTLISTMLQFLAAFVFFLILDVRLAWMVVVIMPFSLLLSKFIMKRMRHLTLDIRQTDSSVQAHLQESVQHITLLQTLERENSVIGTLESMQTKLYGQVMKRTRFSILSRTIVSAAFAAGYTTAFLWGVNGIYEGVISFGMMTAFLQLVGQIQRPLLEMSQQLPSLIHATASADRLRELEGDKREEHGAPVWLETTAGIRMENVTFAYPEGDRNVVENFSYDFKPGSHTAILGETGAGKSTLIRLMLALLKPQQGDIWIYDESRRVKASPSTRCNMVYVPQGNSLLSGTIRDNLLLGNPQATDEEMKEALRMAAAEFVEALPDGLDTVCSEAGGGLSEGQAQRIAIARALLRKGSVLLLDEFSASLDERTEERLMQNLTHKLTGHTMIFITHRLRITDYCEKIIEIKKR